MAGARTEAGPTAAEAGTRMGAVRMEEADRTTPAVAAGGSTQADPASEVRISVAGGAAADSAEAGRRGFHRWRGWVAARTEARRHGNQAAIPRVVTEAEATGVRAVAMAADIAVRADRVTATAGTETQVTETPVVTDARLMAETTALTAVQRKVNAADRMATHTRIRGTVAVAMARHQHAAMPE
jgi:hypothetical protein